MTNSRRPAPTWRDMLTTFIHALLSAQADSVCGAEYGTRTQERINRRNGYRHRDLDTRVGTIDVAIPKLRQGSFFPDWLLPRPIATSWSGSGEECASCRPIRKNPSPAWTPRPGRRSGTPSLTLPRSGPKV